MSKRIVSEDWTGLKDVEGGYVSMAGRMGGLEFTTQSQIGEMHISLNKILYFQLKCPNQL